MAPFIMMPYLSALEWKAWMALTKVPNYFNICHLHVNFSNFVKQVFQLCYCDFYDPNKEGEWRELCTDFVDSITTAYPELSKKQKVHLFMHIIDSMKAFGPTSSYCTER